MTKKGGTLKTRGFHPVRVRVTVRVTVRVRVRDLRPQARGRPNKRRLEDNVWQGLARSGKVGTVSPYMSLSNAETRLAASTERERALEAEVARCRADRLASERRERDACAERDTLKGQLELMMTKATTQQQRHQQHPPALNLKSSAGGAAGAPSSRSHANGDSSARAKSTARALLLHGGAAGV